MKITHIEVFAEAMPLTRPYTIAFRTIADVQMSFVALHTDSGLLGLGCASPEPHVTGETREACAAALTKVTDDCSTLRPNAPNIGRVYTGCGVGIEAFGSPI